MWMSECCCTTEDVHQGFAPAITSSMDETVQMLTPTMGAQSDAKLLSFSQFVEFALLDIRQALVAEHERRLHEVACTKLAQPLTPTWKIETPRRAIQMEEPEPVEPAEPVGYPDLTSSVPVLKKPAGDHMVDSQLSLATTDSAPDSADGEAPWMTHSAKKPCAVRKSLLARIVSRSDSQAARQLMNRAKPRETKKSELVARVMERVIIGLRREPLELVDAIMGFVILANAIAIGASCDTRDFKTLWLVVDSVFAVIFIIEFFVKACLLGLRGYLCGRLFHWAWFEVAIIVMSVAEIVTTIIVDDSLSGASVFRVVRLVRLSKLLRLCRVPMAADLVMMLNGLIGGARTLVWAILLIMFPLSIFCLVMRETLGEEGRSGAGANNFDTLSKASFNTFRCLVVDDCADEAGRPIFVLVADTHGWAYGLIYCLTFVFMKFGLYNVIIAIFVEQTVQAAKYNDIHQKRTRLNDQTMFKEKSLEMAELAYSIKTGIHLENVACNLTLEEICELELSRSEFTELCGHADFKDLLATLDIAEEDHMDLFDTLDVDGGGTLDLGEIISGISKLRGDARKADVVAIILLAKHLSRSLDEFKTETAATLEDHQNQMSFIQNLFQAYVSNCDASLKGPCSSPIKDMSAIKRAAITRASSA